MSTRILREHETMTITLEADTALWILIGVVVVVLVCSIWLLLRTVLLRSRSARVDRQEVVRRWQRIEQLAKSTNESSLRHAVIEADAVFDLGMRFKFFSGKDFGSRLKAAQARSQTLRKVWQAHRLRNELVHESGTSLRHGQAVYAIEIYRNGLKELGLL